jgi:hypothetical protein
VARDSAKLVWFERMTAGYAALAIVAQGLEVLYQNDDIFPNVETLKEFSNLPR